MLGSPSKLRTTFYNENIGSALEFVSESCCCPKERPDNAHGEFLLLAVTWSSHTGVKYFHMEKFPKRGAGWGM